MLLHLRFLFRLLSPVSSRRSIQPALRQVPGGAEPCAQHAGIKLGTSEWLALMHVYWIRELACEYPAWTQNKPGASAGEKKGKVRLSKEEGMVHMEWDGTRRASEPK